MHTNITNIGNMEDSSDQDGVSQTVDEGSPIELSSEQKQRIETKRLKALELRKSRVRLYTPYQTTKDHRATSSSTNMNTHFPTTSTVMMEDSKGGFMLPDNEAVENQRTESSVRVVHETGELIDHSLFISTIL